MFEGSAGEAVSMVRVTADGQFVLGEVEPEDGEWSLAHEFSSPGARRIEATALDSGGMALGQAAVSIVVRSNGAGDYSPPAKSLARLGGIVKKLRSATPIVRSFKKGGKAILKLDTGAIYYESLLDLDSDGSRFASLDQTGRKGTSLAGPGGKPVDAETVPYFVMPGGFFKEFGIRLGDVAVVVYEDKVEYAVFADTGPSIKLGEGSIALHRSLGHETIRNGKFHDEAIDEGVITIVFPGSGDRTPQTPDRIRAIGRKLFSALGGSI